MKLGMDLPPLQVQHPPDHPTLLFDGACGLCRRWIGRWRLLTGATVSYQPFQEATLRFPEIPVASLEQAVHLIETDGSVTRGAEAVAGSLRHSIFGGLPLWCYHAHPRLRRRAEQAYAWVAAHRGGLSQVGTFFHGNLPPPYTYILTRTIFIRTLAVCYLVVFADFLLHAARFRPGATGLLVWPFPWTTVSIDAGAPALGLAGILMALAVIAGRLPTLTLLATWYAALTLTRLSPDPLALPWRLWLLEAGLIAAFYAPPSNTLRDSHRHPPAFLARLLLLWLLFRLALNAGLRDLPTAAPCWSWSPTEWAAGLTLAVSWMIILPRRLRLGAAAGLALARLPSLLAGGTLAADLLLLLLCIPLLDDSLWPQRLRRGLARTPAGTLSPRWLWLLIPHRIALAALAALMLSISLPEVRHTLAPLIHWLAPGSTPP